MATKFTAHKHDLAGDFSITGVVKQLASLTNTLKKLEINQNRKLHVDCTRISRIDMSGLQLLHVWKECARMRGVEPQLINLPEHMHRAIQSMGLERSFMDLT